MNWKEIPKHWWDEHPRCNFCGCVDAHTVVLEDVQNKGHNLVECQCGLRFFAPTLNEAWSVQQQLNCGINSPSVERSYRTGTLVPEDQAPLSHEGQKAFNHQFYAQKYKIAQTFSGRQELLVLDVGCGAGWASRTYKSLGSSQWSLATDVSPAAVHYARLNGANAIQGIFREVVLPRGTFDFISANDFIEHTFTPFDDLVKMRTLIRGNGVLYLKTFNETADEEKFNRSMLNPPDHSHHFTPEMLIKMLDAARWIVVRQDYQDQMMDFYCQPRYDDAP